MKKSIPLIVLILIFLSCMAWAETEDESLEAMEWYGKGIKAKKAMNYDMAIKCINKSISIFNKVSPMLEKEFPEDIKETILHSYADAHALLGMIYEEKGMLVEAASEHKKAVVINPHSITAHFGLGCCYDKLGQKEEAISEYKSALDNSIYVDSDSSFGLIFSQAHYNLGLIYGKKGQAGLSADHLYKAGLLYLEQGDVDGALKSYQGLKEVKDKLAQELYKKLSPKLKQKRRDPLK